ncbi:Glycosyltransferase, GT2 family [Desulfotomaculum arcticum]|uniref:Glycosyltransferase, GT2 family n=1 Tax=Desulfotruncus arcticus DSM 17038 TaxID=1121424 RepID=A0A1I2X057_9FIRM|nr:glycosyltransferase [Desulfotruncus arcticus]SFH06930.1 Glycosyltransferase, GT2 family [Desulfotomaculum arcticum] [Desulfotruncus arcticus DSM 17038]
MELFRFILPQSNICSETELYFRTVPASVSDNSVIFDEQSRIIKLKQGARISFDTYFNCFSYSKYLRYTWVDCVGISLSLKGKFLVRLVAARLEENGQSSEVLQEHLVQFIETDEFKFTQSFASDNTEGIYYIELTALSDEAVFCGGHYFADEIEHKHKVNPIKVAFVICTYKREDFVYRNIRTVNNYIFDNPHSSVKNDMSFFIVDNGHTIDSVQIESRFIKVFKNKNYGGSGGFTRGIIEVYKRRVKYTHVLLMDDDILFEGEVLVKTVNFLKVVKNEHLDTCIGAGMMREDLPYIQHEAGALWKGMHVKSIKTELDLRLREKLVFNEHEEFINYSGWWYMCIPLSLINDKNFPLPLFIKIDDIEYGIRLSKKIILMNGIGIWHEHFDLKYSAYLEYYIKRNETILTAIHFPQFGALASIKKLLFAIGKQHLKRKYSAHYFLFRAYDDFLKGIDFLLQTDEEKLNAQLIQRSNEPSHDGSIVYFPIMLISSGFRFLIMSIKLLHGYQKAAKIYRKRMGEVTSLDFWCRHLDIEENYCVKKI